VNRDAGDPGRKLGATLELAEVSERVHVRLLHDVLGLELVAHDGAGCAIDAAVVPSHEQLEEAGFAVPNPKQKLLVGQGRGFGKKRGRRSHCNHRSPNPKKVPEIEG
jgi:hypothetical protein